MEKKSKKLKSLKGSQTLPELKNRFALFYYSVPCLVKLKHKCKDLVNYQNREKMYKKEFRILSCSDDQRQFLSSHRTESKETRNIENSLKTYTCIFYFTVYALAAESFKNIDAKSICLQIS